MGCGRPGPRGLCQVKLGINLNPRDAGESCSWRVALRALEMINQRQEGKQSRSGNQVGIYGKKKLYGQRKK